MDIGLIVTVVVILLSVVALVTFLKTPPPPEEAEEEEQEMPNNRVARRGLDRMRKKAQKAAGKGAAVKDDGEDGEDVPLEREKLSKTNRMGKKQMEKMQQKEERRRQNEAMAQAREEAKHQRRMEEEEFAAERREKQEEEQEKEAAEKEEERKRLEAEQAEYEEWKSQITIGGESSVAQDTEGESQDLLSEFISFIKERKVVSVEDVAAEFGLHSKDAANRMKALEEMGSITGVFDDRGKFIYITKKEMDSLAKWIRQRGRVTISELTTAANDTIKIKGKKKKRKDKSKGKSKSKDKSKSKSKSKDDGVASTSEEGGVLVS